VLKQNGYNTAWYGKSHNIPDWHSSQAVSAIIPLNWPAVHRSSIGSNVAL
jgi:arylsulfatase A-like enzyme